jgi:hypothetical protein
MYEIMVNKDALVASVAHCMEVFFEKWTWTTFGLLQTSDTNYVMLLFLLLVDVRVPLYNEMVFQYFIMLVTQVRPFYVRSTG